MVSRRDAWLANRARKLAVKGKFPPLHAPPKKMELVLFPPRLDDGPEVTAEDVPDGHESAEAAHPGGHVGVHWSRAARKWRARISVDGKRVSLGFFDSFWDAVEARERAEREYGLSSDPNEP